MEIKHSIERLSGYFRKYKFVCIVILAGLVLMTLPIGTTQKSTTQQEKQATQEPSMEERLIDILSQIRGAGNVRVMLTVAAGEETVFASDQGSSGQKDTVTVTDEDRAETGLVVQVIPPRYLGALVVCQGADDPNVRLAITEAVASLTGLGTNKITIAKMK